MCKQKCLRCSRGPQCANPDGLWTRYYERVYIPPKWRDPEVGIDTRGCRKFDKGSNRCNVRFLFPSPIPVCCPVCLSLGQPWEFKVEPPNKTIARTLSFTLFDHIPNEVPPEELINIEAQKALPYDSSGNPAELEMIPADLEEYRKAFQWIGERLQNKWWLAKEARELLGE